MPTLDYAACFEHDMPGLSEPLETIPLLPPDLDTRRSGQSKGEPTGTSPSGPSKNSIVEMVASHFADAVGQIWAGDRIKEYLTATDARRHVWHTWLSSEKPHFWLHNRMSVDLAYIRLTFARGEDLIADAYSCRPAGIMKALGKLGAQARRSDVYRALVQVLAAGGPAARFLQHEKKLSDEVIWGVATLPPKLRLKPILDILKEGRIGHDGLCFFAGTLAKLETFQNPRLISSILAASKPLDAMWDALQDLPFPAAPWPGNDHLLPVTSRSRLIQIAKEFQNCLRCPDRELEAVMSVINGNRYFYELREEPALLEFVRIESVGWYLREFCGPKNHDVSEGTRDKVLRLLSQEPSFCAVWESRWSARWDGGDTLRQLLVPEY